MQSLLTSSDDIKSYIHNRWSEFEHLHFDQLKATTKDKIQWPSEKKKADLLWYWFKNEKNRSKKKVSLGSVSALDKDEQNEKIFVKEEGNILSQLTKLQTTESRVDLLKNELNKNFIFVLDLVGTLQFVPYPTFLEELFQVCIEIEDPQEQVLLFIRVCALYSEEIIYVDQELVKQTLLKLSGKTTDASAAYGLLKLSYNNEISFDSLPIGILQSFENKYTLDIQSFIRSLQLDSQVALSIPSTVLIFTKPFFTVLRNRGKLLHQGTPPCYLVHIVELIAFSFETEYQTVQKFIALFNKGCLQIYGEGYDLKQLLQ